MNAPRFRSPLARTPLDWIWAPWSVIAWLLAFSIMLGTFLGCAALSLVIPFERFQLQFPARTMASVLRLTLSRVRVRYHRGFDADRVSVYCQNHVSMLDAHVGIRAIPQVFCGLENATHLRLPGYGWLLRLANAIPVYSRASGRFGEVSASFAERKSRGISILTFPEGHRTLDGKVRPLRRGVFVIARTVGLPIVPLAVHGMDHVLPKGTWIIKPGTIDIYVGPQIDVAGLDDSQLAEVVASVHEILSAWSERGEDAVDEELARLAEVVKPRQGEDTSA